MTRIVADPTAFRHEWIHGFTSVYDRYVVTVPGASGVVRAGGPGAGKVSVVIGGGSGHYPAFSGLVGAGLADASVIGDVFTSPSAEQAYRVAAAADGGAGILFSFGNYGGDVLNFGVAERRLRAGGIDCRTVLVTDDVASAPAAEADKRRGIAGTLAVFKTAGAAAAAGAPIDEVERLARSANARTRSIGVAFAGCHLPGHTEPLFTVRPGAVELGLGIHGEPGVRTMDAVSAPELARTLMEPLLAERPAGADRRAVVVLNGLGATKYEELFVLWHHLQPLLGDAGVQVVLPEVGEFVTALDMAGCSLTLFWLDDELAELWAAPVDTPAFRRGDVGRLQAFAPLGVTPPVPAGDDGVPDSTPESRQGAAGARAALAHMLAAARAEEEELGRLDAVAGDGDHGSGMTRGLQAAAEAAEETDGGLGTVLRRAGRAFADRAGGTSGVLWGLLIETVGDAVGDERLPDDAAVARAVTEATGAVTEIGRAQVGDKTLLDALVPFAQQLTDGVAAGRSLADAWGEAAGTARQGADATAAMRPRVGRARPLADRSVGTPDPGAVSMALCLEAAGHAVAGDARSAREGAP